MSSFFILRRQRTRHLAEHSGKVVGRREPQQLADLPYLVVPGGEKQLGILHSQLPVELAEMLPRAALEISGEIIGVEAEMVGGSFYGQRRALGLYQQLPQLFGEGLAVLGDGQRGQRLLHHLTVLGADDALANGRTNEN